MILMMIIHKYKEIIGSFQWHKFLTKLSCSHYSNIFVIILKQKTLCEAVKLDTVYCLFLQIKLIVLAVKKTNTQQMNEPYKVHSTMLCFLCLLFYINV